MKTYYLKNTTHEYAGEGWPIRIDGERVNLEEKFYFDKPTPAIAKLMVQGDVRCFLSKNDLAVRRFPGYRVETHEEKIPGASARGATRTVYTIVDEKAERRAAIERHK